METMEKTLLRSNSIMEIEKKKKQQLTFGNHFGFFLQDLRLRYHSLL